MVAFKLDSVNYDLTKSKLIDIDNEEMALVSDPSPAIYLYHLDRLLDISEFHFLPV